MVLGGLVGYTIDNNTKIFALSSVPASQVPVLISLFGHVTAAVVAIGAFSKLNMIMAFGLGDIDHEHPGGACLNDCQH